MPLDVYDNNGVKIISLNGRLDVNTALNLEVEVLSFIEDFSSSTILFDLSGSDYISASIMHLFMSVSEKTKIYSIKSGVVSSDTIKKIFKNIGLTSFRMYDNLENALSDINN